MANLEEELEMQKMKMRAEQFEEDYKKQKRMPAKLKPRVFGCFWNHSSDSHSILSENSDKERIVHDQLMKILQPYCCVVLLGDNESENDHDDNPPIQTSHSINIRVSNSVYLLLSALTKYSPLILVNGGAMLIISRYII